MAGRRSPPPFHLRPCGSSSTSHPPPDPESGSASLKEPSIADPKGKKRSSAPPATRGALCRRKVAILKPMKKTRSGSPPSSSSSSTVSRAGHVRDCVGDGPDHDELGLPLGMSFGAVVVQIWKSKQSGEESIPADRLSTVCLSAVREAVTNVYGEKYQRFLINFEKSFFTTMRTLQVISKEGSFVDKDNLSRPSSSSQSASSANPTESLASDCIEEIQVSQPRTPAYIEVIQNSMLNASEFVEDDRPTKQDSQIMVLNGPNNQQLMPVSGNSSRALGQAILSTFEKSVVEQARSNELKAVELGLTLQRMQLKQSQLDLTVRTNVLEEAKLSMGLKEMQFKEEKLKNRMQDLRHAEFLRRCIDLLVAGLFIMSASLGYAAWVYSYKRIIEATESCTHSPKESKSWWMPKQVSSFNTALLLLRCHTMVLSRMSFGIVMILVVAYLLFQRSAGTGPIMPVTFIVFILGGLCGLAGKVCIDTLGGDGYWWLLNWESLCFLHLLVNVFPSFAHPLLYGPVYDSQKLKYTLLPHWIRRLVFYGALLLVLPTLGGLLPFATVGDWKDHFTKLLLVHFGDEYGNTYSDL